MDDSMVPDSESAEEPREQPDAQEPAIVAVAAGRLGFEPARGITRIEWRPGLAHFAVKAGGRRPKLASVFRHLAESGLSVDMIKLLPPGIRFSLSESHTELAAETLRGLNLEFDVTPECAVLALYAPDMRSLSGIMATVVGVLDHGGVRVLSTDDSYNAIFCVIHSADGPRACQALANEFGLDSKTDRGPSVEW